MFTFNKFLNNLLKIEKNTYFETTVLDVDTTAYRTALEASDHQGRKLTIMVASSLNPSPIFSVGNATPEN